MNKETFWLCAGLAMFAGLAGFLAGANNAAVVSGALVAAIGALAGITALAEKVHIDKAAQTMSVAESSQAAESARGLRMKQLAQTLGVALVAIALGFAGGYWAGLCASDSTVARIAEPWADAKAPDKFDEAVGWIAVAEKMQKAGYSQRQIQRVYEKYHQKTDANVVLPGKQWLGTVETKK